MLFKYLAVSYCAIAVGQAHALKRDAGPSPPEKDWKAEKFAQSCLGLAFSNNEINAQCNDTMQRLVWSRLHLGRCLVNEDGSLKASNGGGAPSNANVSPDPTALSSSKPQLTLVLGNFGGRLCCGKDSYECGDIRLYNDKI
ncbi:unnamed protein product [Colletotrichum noveboracense]|uniref:Cyanovirin-N domain-containing protein n=1 Tax=Colletotrichum noveboracense TaxID=2664923 RepID=A0A9W4WEV7_9PEZI|nr:unnamed protein product [Colletotrichum noveboracense]